MRVPAGLCAMCKGYHKLCGLSYCPVLKKMEHLYNIKERLKLKEKLFGPSGEVFISSSGYPFLSAGPIVSLEGYINPKELYGREYSEIIRLRSYGVMGKRFITASERLKEKTEEVALSIKAIDVEVEFSKAPSPKITFSPVVQPIGPSAPMKKLIIAENPKIPKKVDYVIEEGIKATEGAFELFKAGYDEYYLTNIFSVGALGKKENKHIVPTRWSITAIDDILAKEMMKKIREAPEINDITVYENEYLFNKFIVVFLPGKWEFENFEAWGPNSVWARFAKDYTVTEEYEGFNGRTKYAQKQVGGYYASRFSVVEFLFRIRKQARVVVFREINEGYTVPVGVWEVRENVRHALRKRGLILKDKKELFRYLKMKLTVPLERYLSMSRVLHQTKLTEFQ